MRSYFLQNNKEYSKAIEAYKEIIPMERTNYRAMFNIGYCYLQLDSIDKAYKHLRNGH
jgi:tetratricopeptide (TPR) repeat protein